MYAEAAESDHRALVARALLGGLTGKGLRAICPSVSLIVEAGRALKRTKAKHDLEPLRFFCSRSGKG
eukprot:3418948-Alexandrium_andersonii.AAC.1